MTKYEFLSIVKNNIKYNPEWLEDTIKAASEGMLAKVDECRQVDVDIQHALILMKEFTWNRINKDQKIQVLKSITKCDRYHGSILMNKIHARIAQLENEQ